MARPGDGQRPALDLGPLRIQPAVADDVERSPAVGIVLDGERLEIQADGIDEDLGHGAAVDVHLLKPTAARVDVDHDRRKRARNRRRGDHQRVEQIHGLRLVAGGDPRHVPDVAHAGVEVGRGDPQLAALGVLGRDRVQEGAIDVLAKHLAQGLGVGHGVAGQAGQIAAQLEDILGGDVGVERLQLAVVGGAQEGERRDQGAGADAGTSLNTGRSPAAVQPFSTPAPNAPDHRRRRGRGRWWRAGGRRAPGTRGTRARASRTA